MSCKKKCKKVYEIEVSCSGATGSQGIPGPEGPSGEPGSTGPTGSSFALAFGEIYGSSSIVGMGGINDYQPITGLLTFSPFSQNVTFLPPATIEISQPGIYEVEFNATVRIQDISSVIVSGRFFIGGTPFIFPNTFVNQQVNPNEPQNLNLSAITEFVLGDAVDVRFSVSINTTILIDSYNLIVKRIG